MVNKETQMVKLLYIYVLVKNIECTFSKYANSSMQVQKPVVYTDTSIQSGLH